MAEILKNSLLSPFGSFASILSLLLLAFWLVYWVTKKVTTINNSHDGLVKTNNKIEANIDEIRKDLSYLKGSFDFIKESFNIFKKGASPMAESFSPIRLTDIGKEKSKIINAEEMIARNWDKIYDNLEENIDGKNAYDIQQYCMDTAAMYPDKFLSDADIDSIKMLAYREGNPLLYYSPLFAIPIRDKYLSIKGINVSEIDTNDPSKIRKN